MKIFAVLLALLPLIYADVISLGSNSRSLEIDFSAHRYRIVQKDGKAGMWVNQDLNLHLKLGKMIPTENLPQEYLQNIKKEYNHIPESLATSAPRSAQEKSGLYLVQFHSQLLPEFRARLEEHGAKIYFPFPSQAVLISLPAGVVEKVRGLTFVRWVGEYLPVFRLGSDVFQEISQVTDFKEKSYRFNLMLVERGPKLQKLVSGAIEREIGGKVIGAIREGFRMEVFLTLDQLFKVLRRGDVYYADLWTAPSTDMNIVRLSGGLDYITSVKGFNGEGVRAEVMDSGLYTNHTDLRDLNIIIHRGNGASTSHGSSVFGIVFGSGAGNRQATGGLSKADASIFAAYEVLSTSYTRYEHTAQLVDPEGEYRSVFQTNSWGDAQTTSYTTISAEMDDIIFLNDILILQSQSNTGSRRSRPQAWAKNILSVGAFYHYDTLTRSDDRWNSGASIGPAEDGRQKPDLSNFYDQVVTTSNTNAGYTQFSGTSAATPITAGHFGIFYQLWADGVFAGTPGRKGDVFDLRPHSSTAKALMINTANQYDFTGETAELNRFIQGWGTPDLANLYDLAKINAWKFPVLVDESDPITPFEILSYRVTINRGDQPTFLKVTLVYRDPAPAVSASKQLINNLDLQVTSPSGKIYWGNNGLTQGVTSTEGGEPSAIDNVENVFVRGVEAGVWTISVWGTEIVQDANPSTEVLDAVFSLVATKGRNFV